MRPHVRNDQTQPSRRLREPERRKALSDGSTQRAVLGFGDEARPEFLVIPLVWLGFVGVSPSAVLRAVEPVTDRVSQAVVLPATSAESFRAGCQHKRLEVSLWELHVFQRIAME